MNTKITVRPISTIACEIAADWKKVNFAAKPYLDAMFCLNTVNDMYYFDSAKSIILYFLCNAGTWKGEVAKRIKAELKAMCK
jgi:hypothetical protein